MPVHRNRTIRQWELMSPTQICVDLPMVVPELCCREVPTLHLYRAILSALVAVAIVLAPTGAAWAGGAKMTAAAMAHTTSHLVGSEAASPMEDCASMMKGAAGTADCPCCEKDKACSPQLCMAKCFQFQGLLQQSRPFVRLVTAVFRPTTSAHPPDWSDQPQPPPPRT